MLALGALLLAIATSAPEPIARISAYAGTWHVEITRYATKYSKARTETSELRNDCWHSAEYYACHQFLNGRSAALIVFTYDPAAKLYRSHVISSGAQPDGGGTLLIRGHVWTFPWSEREGHTTVHMRIVNTFVNAGTIKFRQEYSLDGKTWTPIADGIEHRVAS